MNHRHPIPPVQQPPSLGRRLWAGLVSGLQVGLVMSLVAWISWLACGVTEDFRYHVTSTGEDQLRGGLTFFQLSVITSGLLAAAKPACTSRARCALVGAAIGFADGIATAPLGYRTTGRCVALALLTRSAAG